MDFQLAFMESTYSLIKEQTVPISKNVLVDVD